MASLLLKIDICHIKNTSAYLLTIKKEFDFIATQLWHNLRKPNGFENVKK